MSVMLLGTQVTYAEDASVMEQVSAETEKSGSITVKPATLTEMETGKSYLITTPANKDTKYSFKYVPEKSAGYNLQYWEKSNMNIVDTVVLSEEGKQLASGCGYYMLEAGKEYFFEIVASSNTKAQSGSGSLIMEEYCPWEECVTVKNNIATGLTNEFRIVHIPEGVTGMARNISFNTLYIGTLVLPESMQKIDFLDLWYAYYQYYVSGDNGRYLSDDGVLYDWTDKTLRVCPPKREGVYQVKEGTERIDAEAFKSTDLTELYLPDSVKEIDYTAFSSNTLKRLNLSYQVENVQEIFGRLYALETINVTAGNPRYESREGVLLRKQEDGTYSLAYYPIGKIDSTYTIPKDVSELEPYCFLRFGTSESDDMQIRNLKMIVIPETVTKPIHSTVEPTQRGGLTHIIIKGSEGSEAHKYWQRISEGMKKYIHWVSLEKVNLGFELGRDNNSFCHYDYTDKNSGFYEVDRYYLTDEDYNKLFQIPMNEGTQKWLRDNINGDVKWHGACFGSTVTLGLIYNGKLSVSDISNSGKQSIFDLSLPRYDKKYLSTLHYYHLLQNFDVRDRAIAVIKTSFWEIDTPSEKVADMFEEIISYIDQRKTVIMTTDNHAVLITGYEETGDGYIFQIYDLNSVNELTPKGDIYHMTVNSDLTEFSCPEIGLSRKQQKEIVAMLPEKIEPKSAYEIAENVTNIIVDATKKVRITDADGKYLSNNGEKWSGDMKVEDIQFIRNAVGDKDSSKQRFIVTGESSYIFSDTAENVETSVFNEQEYISLRGKGIESAEVILGEGIHLYGDDYSFRVVISTENEVAENEEGLIAISGNAKGNVEITVDYDTVSVNSEKGIEEIKAESYVKNDSIQLEVPEKLGAGKKENIVVGDPENPDPENPDPENPNPEKPDSENQQNDIEEDKGNNDINTEKEEKENQDKTPATGDGQGLIYLLYALGLSSMTAGAIVCKRKKKK